LHKGLIVAALMMSTSLAALDQTVVGTALPTIVGSLGGLEVFSWVFSVYLLTSTVSVPLFGKASDLYGRKPILLSGCIVFLVGSLLCGIAASMPQLIAFRAIQGLGAGAVIPATMTIVGDVFSTEERVKLNGLFGSVWGVAALAGPTVGGVLTDTIGWRFVFYINLPLGLLSILIIWRFFQERAQKKQHVIDYWGTIFLSGAILSLLLGLLQSVDRFGWTGAPTLGAFGLATLLTALFLRQETRAPEPVLPLWLFRNRIIAIASVMSFVVGTTMYGFNSYVPLFVQAVHGGSAIDAGLVIAPVSIGWPIAAVFAGRLILRRGYFISALIGALIIVAGSIELLFVSYSSPQWLTSLVALTLGVGLGFSSSAFLISIQNAVSWRYRGVATASTQFFRTIGGSIWVAVMGAIFNSQLAQRLQAIEGAPAGASADTLLNPAERAALPAQVIDAMRHAVASSLHEVYFLILLMAVISFVTVLFFPRGSTEELAFHEDEEQVPPPAKEPALSLD
jgi:EmrB/QacA subfamily drug resistance transporter